MIRQEDIYLKNTIVHILDSTVGMPVLSDTELEHGSDFADFIKAHRRTWICQSQSGYFDSSFYDHEPEYRHSAG